MKKYALTVWYRIGDEKDFDYHEIEAESELGAEIKVREMYNSLSKIIFKVEHICQ